MAGFADAALDAAADGIATRITAVSLHSADPGADGTAAELAGGGYARQTPTYAAAAGTVASLSAPLGFSVAAGATVAFYGLWAGAVFFGGFALTAAETFANAGTFSLTDAAIDASAG